MAAELDCSQWVGGASAEWGDVGGVKRNKSLSWFIPVSGTLRNGSDTTTLHKQFWRHKV